MSQRSPIPVGLDLSPTSFALRTRLLSRVLALFALSLVAATWPLWTPEHGFPQVPLIGRPTLFSSVAQWIALAGMLVSLMGLLLRPVPAAGSRACLIALALCAGYLVLADQQRLQPWMYQFLLWAAVLSLCEPALAIRLLRLL